MRALVHFFLPAGSIPSLWFLQEIQQKTKENPMHPMLPAFPRCSNIYLRRRFCPVRRICQQQEMAERVPSRFVHLRDEGGSGIGFLLHCERSSSCCKAAGTWCCGTWGAGSLQQVVGCRTTERKLWGRSHDLLAALHLCPETPAP